MEVLFSNYDEKRGVKHSSYHYGIEKEIVLNKEDNKSWVEKSYRNGKLECITPFKNNIISGVVRTFFDDCNFETHFVNGKRHGVARGYDNKGRIISETTYMRGFKIGVARHFYANGQIRIESRYRDNYKQGIEREYYKNGAIKKETYYEWGDKEGAEKTYRKNGGLKRIVFYKRGKKVAINREKQIGLIA